MNEGNEQDQGKERLSLRSKNRTDGGRTVDAGSVRQSFSHGRTKVVQVEVRKKRGASRKQAPGRSPTMTSRQGAAARGSGRALTATELAMRQRVLEEQQKEDARKEIEVREQEKIMILSAAEEARKREEEQRKDQEESAKSKPSGERLDNAQSSESASPEFASGELNVGLEIPNAPIPEKVTVSPPTERLRPLAERAIVPSSPAEKGNKSKSLDSNDAPHSSRNSELGRAQNIKGTVVLDEDQRPRRSLGGRKNSGSLSKKGSGGGRRAGRIDILAAIEGEEGKTRSLASMRRQRERERRQAELEKLRADQVKVVRDVILPESITVQELANRMAVRQAQVIKTLMKMGVMVTANQTLDADTAELVVEEFGHRVRRVAESDVEIGIEGVKDELDNLKPRAPVVTIMGHVDHGKTSLLDALRATSVVSGEAGGITQHIGAYQVVLPGGGRISFIDTPGHGAFTAMRARGASVTDIVVLVVAADDGVMPQTIEAIRHAKLASVPIILAINKIDKPNSQPERIRQELLNHEVVVESLGGDTQEVEISAKKRVGLEALEEAILLQAEILDLKANPDRVAEGTVIESKLDRGRGSVATVLVQKGTLKNGDIIVAGAEWGRVRAMLDDKNRKVLLAGPSTPVEVLGLSNIPDAGEPFVVVKTEVRAREISAFRQRKIRDKVAAVRSATRGTLDQMLARIHAGQQKELALLIKADVQGSAEAIQSLVQGLDHEEVEIRVIMTSVGQISESDIQLAKASDAIVIAFNVRATSQARQLADREGVDVKYYSIIYQVSDDVQSLVRDRVAPKEREKFLGYAEIRHVFDISKVGKIAGCYVTEGVVKRGCGVRLLRSGIVVHEGELAQLKRFKDDVREVAHGYECGLSFTGFNDIREGDVVECFETELVRE